MPQLERINTGEWLYGEPSDDETIVGSACFYRGAVISLPKPARHRNVLDAAISMGLDANAVGYHQGFITSTAKLFTSPKG